jgi:hypothetical protein
MEHFSEQTCVDFVRGVSGLKISNDIRRHLAQGCSICKTDLAAWNRVRRVATDEAAYAPPENLVRLVKLGFASKAAQESPTWTLASLVFDSFAQPLMSGVRSGALNFWQVIYEAEGLSVDLRFGHHAQSKAVHLVGQVFDKQAARALQNNASIELSTEREQLLATTTVSTLGEFYIEYEAYDPLWLAIKAAGRNPVRIPLTNPKQR